MCRVVLKIEQQHQAGIVVGRCVGAVVVVVVVASADPARYRLGASVQRKLYVHLVVVGLQLRYSYLGVFSIFGLSLVYYRNFRTFLDSRLRVCFALKLSIWVVSNSCFLFAPEKFGPIELIVPKGLA